MPHAEYVSAYALVTNSSASNKETNNAVTLFFMQIPSFHNKLLEIPLVPDKTPV